MVFSSILKLFFILLGFYHFFKCSTVLCSIYFPRYFELCYQYLIQCSGTIIEFQMNLSQIFAKGDKNYLIIRLAQFSKDLSQYLRLFEDTWNFKKYIALKYKKYSWLAKILIYLMLLYTHINLQIENLKSLCE